MDKDLLGQKVTFARLNEKDEEITGEGVVHALFITPDKRVSVRVRLDDGTVVNTDMAAINLTDTGRKRYFEGMRLVRKRAEEINASIKEMTAAGNAELESIQLPYLGAQLKI